MPTTRNQAGATATRINAFIDAYLQALAETTGDPTMGLQQIRLLTALYVNKALNQADLEQYTGVKKTANGKNIDRLGRGTFREQGLGLLESEHDEMDRRHKRVRLTPKGTAVMDEVATKVAKYYGEP